MRIPPVRNGQTSEPIVVQPETRLSALADSDPPMDPLGAIEHRLSRDMALLARLRQSTLRAQQAIRRAHALYVESKKLLEE